MKAALIEKGWPTKNLVLAGWDYTYAAAQERPEVTWDDEYDPDACFLVQGREMAERLGKTFGPALKDSPDAAAAMLLSYGRETTKRILQSRFLDDLRDEIEAEELEENEGQDF